MRSLGLVALITTAACNQVFGLDPITSGGDDGGPGDGAAATREVTFTRDRLTASQSVVETAVPDAVRYLVRDDREPSGYLTIPATIVGQRATASVPSGPYLVEVTYPGAAPLYVASDAPLFAYHDLVYGRADVDHAIVPGSLVNFEIQLPTNVVFAPDDQLVVDTFGMWSRAPSIAGSISGDGSASSPLRWALPWTGDAISTPPDTALGYLSVADHVVVSQRRPAGAGWDTVTANSQPAPAHTGGAITYSDTLAPLAGGQRVSVTFTDNLVGRVDAIAPTMASCVGRLELRAVPWPATGNPWGVGVSAVEIVGSSSSISTGAIPGLPPAYAERLVTTVTCPYDLGGSLVAVYGEYHDTVATARASLPIPFVTGVRVAGSPLSSTTNTVVLPDGVVELQWTVEAGVPAPDLYSVVVSRVATPQTPVFRALTASTALALPAGTLTVGGDYTVLITAVTGRAGFGDGDLAPTGKTGWTTTPSPRFVIAPRT